MKKLKVWCPKIMTEDNACEMLVKDDKNLSIVAEEFAKWYDWNSAEFFFANAEREKIHIISECGLVTIFTISVKSHPQYIATEDTKDTLSKLKCEMKNLSLLKHCDEETKPVGLACNKCGCIVDRIGDNCFSCGNLVETPEGLTCDECGSSVVRNGTMIKCFNCGKSIGCS